MTLTIDLRAIWNNIKIIALSIWLAILEGPSDGPNVYDRLAEATRLLRRQRSSLTLPDALDLADEIELFLLECEDS